MMIMFSVEELIGVQVVKFWMSKKIIIIGHLIVARVNKTAEQSPFGLVWWVFL